MELVDPVGLDFRDGELELRLETTKPGDALGKRVPSYHFSMRVGGEAVGSIRLRVGNDTDLISYVGHVGYDVMPEFRGKRRAERATRLLLPLALLNEMNEIWITCNPDNIASRLTCERLGADLIGIVEVPPEHSLYAAGERLKCRYRYQTRPA